MLPAIFPGDLIHLRRPEPGDFRIGTIVCFPTSKTQLSAHRIIETRLVGSQKTLRVRGDSQHNGEWVPEVAVAYVVQSVDGRLGRWARGDWRDRLFQKWALVDRKTHKALWSATIGTLCLVDRLRPWCRRSKVKRP